MTTYTQGFYEAVSVGEGNNALGWSIVILVIGIVWATIVFINNRTEIKIAQIEAFSKDDNDLLTYTEWLSEKGALREGFGEANLVSDYNGGDD